MQVCARACGFVRTLAAVNAPAIMFLVVTRLDQPVAESEACGGLSTCEYGCGGVWDQSVRCGAIIALLLCWEDSRRKRSKAYNPEAFVACAASQLDACVAPSTLQRCEHMHFRTVAMYVRICRLGICCKALCARAAFVHPLT